MDNLQIRPIKYALALALELMLIFPQEPVYQSVRRSLLSSLKVIYVSSIAQEDYLLIMQQEHAGTTAQITHTLRMTLIPAQECVQQIL
jgi:hypothetical protein